MKIESPAFKSNEFIPDKYTCVGENINPPLKFSEIPAGAISLALLVTDPDASIGTWVHWMVWNIDPKLNEIGEDSIPPGIEGGTSFGKSGYGGPCPPSGIHHYIFKLYALDTSLSLPEAANRSDFDAAINGHILDTSELVGLYQRNSVT